MGGQEGYITVGLYDDGSPGEVFVKMSKQGSTVSGLMDSVAIAWSMALQHGVPIESLISKYIDHRFEPSGFTGNPRIPMARSVVDYLARWMASKFLSEEDQRIAGVLPGVSPEPEADATDDAPEDQLSFSAVAEPEADANGNGNGNGHGATATAEPPVPARSRACPSTRRARSARRAAAPTWSAPAPASPAAPAAPPPAAADPDAGQAAERRGAPAALGRPGRPGVSPRSGRTRSGAP